MGVELGCLTAGQHKVVFAQDEPQTPAQHVQPIRSPRGYSDPAPGRGSRREDQLVGLQRAGIAGRGDGPGGRRWAGHPRARRAGSGCARARGSSSSRLARRCPDSSRDKVLTEMPVASDRSARVTCRR
jgi:hypothetical protein